MGKTKLTKVTVDIKLKPVTSSNIKEVNYMEEPQTLVVKFNNEKVYTYQPVTPDQYQALITASSIGSHLNTHIKNNDAITCTPQPQ